MSLIKLSKSLDSALGEFFLVRRKVNKLLKVIFKSSDIILDVGCGKDPYYHKNIKAKIICTDIVDTKKTHFVSDAMSIPLKSSKFDGIVCVNSLYYHKDPFRSIKEFSRVLKRNARLVLITPFIYPIHDAPDDKYRFTEYGIKELLKNDFDIREIKTIGSIFNIPAVFFHSLIKGIPLMVPKEIRKFTSFLSTVVLHPFYFIAQLISILDFFDTSGRWPTYYFTIAIKK